MILTVSSTAVSSFINITVSIICSYLRAFRDGSVEKRFCIGSDKMYSVTEDRAKVKSKFCNPKGKEGTRSIPLYPSVTLPKGRTESTQGVNCLLCGHMSKIHQHKGQLQWCRAPPHSPHHSWVLIEGHWLPPGTTEV